MTIESQRDFYRQRMFSIGTQLVKVASERDEYRDKATAVAEQNLRLMAERDRYKTALLAIAHQEWQGATACRCIATAALHKEDQ